MSLSCIKTFKKILRVQLSRLLSLFLNEAQIKLLSVRMLSSLYFFSCAPPPFKTTSQRIIQYVCTPLASYRSAFKDNTRLHPCPKMW